jgi:Arc/MetJ-type ribon-helix-helix transcriptional regulator
MASRSTSNSSPLTFDLPDSLLVKIESLRRQRNLKSVSEVVRLAVDEFDFTSCEFTTDPFRQISVRVADAQRGVLKRVARQKRASVGEVVRRAIEALPIKPTAAVKKKRAAR